MHPTDVDISNEPTQARTTVESIAQRLREDILSGRYPPEARLPTEELRQRYGVGASTVREALSRLMSESLVTAVGQRGFRVAPMSIRDFQEISALRKLLECKALRKSIMVGDDEWEANLVARYYTLSKIEKQLRQHASLDDTDQARELVQRWSQANEEFHNALVAACGNSWLMRIRRLLHSQSHRYIRLSLTSAGTNRDVHEEHRAIYQAALDRDADEACRLIEAHIDNTVNIVIDKLRSKGF